MGGCRGSFSTMLGLQASNLDEQERLFKNQIRLGLREILQQELGL